MFNDQTKAYISGLSDSELLEYVLTGSRAYEAEPLAFAKAELERRAIPEERLEVLRPAIVEELARYDADQPDDTSLVGTSAILCKRCGCEVPNRYVLYHRTIGAGFWLFHKQVHGHFCRSCNHRVFWKTTLITFFAGWWGFLSFFFTLVFLPTNIITFVRSFSIPRRPPSSGPPSLDEASCTRIESQIDLISRRLDEGMDIANISREVAPLSGVTPGQVWLYVQEMVRTKVASLKPSDIRGFPVILKSPPSGV